MVSLRTALGPDRWDFCCFGDFAARGDRVSVWGYLGLALILTLTLRPVSLLKGRPSIIIAKMSKSKNDRLNARARTYTHTHTHSLSDARHEHTDSVLYCFVSSVHVSAGFTRPVSVQPTRGSAYLHVPALNRVALHMDLHK